MAARSEDDDSFLGLPLHEQREVLKLLNMVDVEDADENGGLIRTL
jgi:hypothetical protein